MVDRRRKDGQNFLNLGLLSDSQADEKPMGAFPVLFHILCSWKSEILLNEQDEENT